MKNRTVRNRILCSVLLGVNLLVIWGNSLLPGSVSGEISGGLAALLTRILDVFGGNGELLLRKAAHFSEFACLGLLLGWLFGLLKQKGIHRFTLPLLVGILCAMTDEPIQVFVPQRGPSVIDVWIDTAGIAAGIGILLFGQTICHKRKTNHIGGN